MQLQLIDSNQIIYLAIGQVATSYCHNPNNPLELALTVAIVGGVGVFAAVGGIAVMSVASTLVTNVISKAAIAVIAAAIAVDAVTSWAAIEIVAQLVYAIKDILGYL